MFNYFACKKIDIICIVFICPITYKLITRVFKDFNSIPIRITAIILTLIFSFLFIPTDNSNVSNTIENNKVVEDIISKEENNELEQKKLEEEKKKLEEEKAKFEEEKRKQEEEKIKQQEEKRKQEEEKAERIKNGETELKNGKFTLKAGHKGYYDGYFSYYIEGEIVNNTKNSYSYVQIQFNVYDSTGAQIGSAMDNINNLEANGTWKFKAIDLSGEPENIAYYKVIDITAF